MSAKCALVMAGGTGGHIFPGLAVAEALRARGWRVHWLGAPASMEAQLVPPRGFDFEAVEFGGVRGKGVSTLVLLPLRLLKAFGQSIGVIRRVKPDVIRPVLETQYSLPHGIAVAQGMILAAELSAWKGEMQQSELRMLQSALEKAGLLPELLMPANIVSRIARDKKGESGSVNFVLLRTVGRAIIRRLSLTEIQEFVNYFNDRENLSQNI